METSNVQAQLLNQTVVITPEAFLEHWQGHRRVTRRVIEAFPEKELFTYSIGGMRTFAELVMEMFSMTVPTAQGVVTGEWKSFENRQPPATKAELLALWDEDTRQLNSLWPQIAPQRFQQVELAFGLYEGPLYSIIMYVVDNEIHHRGQGYVYLRSLGIEPPAFLNRD